MNKVIKIRKNLLKAVKPLIFTLVSLPLFVNANSDCIRQWRKTKKQIDYVKKSEVCGHEGISFSECKEVLGIGEASYVEGAAISTAVGATLALRKYGGLKPSQPEPKVCMKDFGFLLDLNLFSKAYAAGCMEKKSHQRLQRERVRDAAKRAIQSENDLLSKYKRNATSLADYLDNPSNSWENRMKNYPYKSKDGTFTKETLKMFLRDRLDVEGHPQTYISEETIKELDKKYPGFADEFEKQKKLKPKAFKVATDRKIKSIISKSKDLAQEMDALKLANEDALKRLRNIDVDKVEHAGELFQHIMASIGDQGEIFDNQRAASFFDEGVPNDEIRKYSPEKVEILEERQKNTNKIVAEASERLELDGRKFNFSNVLKRDYAGNDVYKKAMLKAGARLGAAAGAALAFPIGTALAAADTVLMVKDVAMFVSDNFKFCKSQYESTKSVTVDNKCNPAFVMNMFVGLTNEEQFDILSDPKACEIFQLAEKKYPKRKDWQIECKQEGLKTIAKLINLKQPEQQISVNLGNEGALQSVDIKYKKNQKKPNIIRFNDGGQISSFKEFHPTVYGDSYKERAISGNKKDNTGRLTKSKLLYYGNRLASTEASYCCSANSDCRAGNCDQYTQKYQICPSNGAPSPTKGESSSGSN